MRETEKAATGGAHHQPIDPPAHCPTLARLVAITPAYSPSACMLRLPLRACSAPVKDRPSSRPSLPAPERRVVKLQITQTRSKPVKQLGQHFLQDLSVVAAAVAAAGVSPGDTVLEVGPGTGILTRALLAAGATVVALEKDRALAEALAANNSDLVASGVLTVVQADALRWLETAQPQFPAVPAGAAGGARRAKVVANIPYAITKELLSLLLPSGDAFSQLVLLVQEEVAQRLVVAKAGASYAREMSIRCRFYAASRYVRAVPRSAFAPPPNVDSAVVRFNLARPEDWPLPREQAGAFFGMVRVAFGARRKMLRKTLPGCEEVLAAAGLPADARPQTLSLENYVTLFRTLRGKLPAVADADAEDAEVG